MRAWRVRRPGPMTTHPLERVTVDVPRPGRGELLVAVHACGVCRTDLHLAEGDLPVHRPGVIPGHEVVGEVAALGEGAGDEFAVGDRVGIAWLRHTCEHCKFCVRGQENLCPESRYTGWDADGGYAEFATVPAAFAHHLPVGYSDTELAPLLCAGIIGYRSLLRADLPADGRLGIYGFGGSAHLTAQVALAQGAEVHVMTRGERARELALSLGAASAQGATDRPPVALDAAILFAPVGDLVPPALEGGRHPGCCGHLPQRHPRVELRTPPLPGAPGAIGHLQHPQRRARVPRVCGEAPHRRDQPGVSARTRTPGTVGSE